MWLLGMLTKLYVTFVMLTKLYVTFVMLTKLYVTFGDAH
jgi:hypothetical protein